MGVIREFQEFAVKGNALDMAVGLIIGLAFNKVVTSVVNDILMPPIGLLVGGVEFSDLMVVLRGAHPGPGGTIVPPVAIHYGLLVNAVIEFLIIAFSAFVVVKAMNRLIRRREAAAAS